MNFDFEIPRGNFNHGNQSQNFYPQRSTRMNVEPQTLQRGENLQYPQNDLNLTYTIPPRNPYDFPQRNMSFDRNISHRDMNYDNQQSNFDMPQRGRNANRINTQTDVEQENTRGSFLRRLRMIPKFNGESFQDLKDFIDITETLNFSCINRAEEQELFEHMVLQLRGEAKTLVSRLNNFDFETIKNALLQHFAYLANKNVLSSQLENLHQEKDESLSKYTERARKLLREKNAVYNNLTEEQRLEHNRIARRAFSRGISDTKLRNQMLTRGASSLEDAIAFAIEAENDAITDIPRNELFCKYCLINGHRENDCRRKESANSDVGKLASALRTMGNAFGRNQGNFRTNQRNFGSNNFGPNNFGPNNFGPNNFGRNNFAPNNFGNWNRNMNPNFNRNWNGNRNWNSGNFNPNRGWNNGNFNNNSNRNWSNGNFNNYQNRNWNSNNSDNNRNNNGNTSDSSSQQNRGNWQQNQRQRSNNFIRRARINAIETDSQSDYGNLSSDYQSEN